MKEIILLSFLTLPLVFNAQNTADYTVYYEFKCISDTVDRTFFSTEEFILLRVGEASRFMTSAQYYNDSIVSVFSNNYPQPNFKSQRELQAYADLVKEKIKNKPIRSNYRIIKNFATGNFISIRMYSLAPIQYMEESMNMSWSITNEVDTMFGLPCTKATTHYGGRDYEAWFTSEVPISDGPYVFQGLPGLILKLADGQGWYTFKVKQIITENTDRYISPNWLNEYAQKIDRETFVNKMIERKNNPRMPTSVLNYPEEKMLERKKLYEKRFDLLIEKY